MFLVLYLEHFMYLGTDGHTMWLLSCSSDRNLNYICPGTGLGLVKRMSHITLDTTVHRCLKVFT